MFRFLFPSLCILLLASCGGQTTVSEAEAPTATVLLRNGTKLVGKVVESSPKQIKIAVAGNPPQTFLMADVKRVEYAEAAPPPATAPSPSAGGAPAATPPPAPAPEVAHDDHPHPVATAVTTRTNSLPVGTEISVRNEETIDSGKAVEGQRFAAEVIRDVKDADGDVVIPRGANAQIVIRSASKGGKIRGASDLILDLETVSVDGKQYTLSTADLAQKGRDGVGANKRTAEFAGGGAAIGAIIGAIAGGGKGAAIGAGSGAGGGALAQVLTKGGSIKVPVETVLTFKLDRRLRVAASE
jgi:hypothetical protein